MISFIIILLIVIFQVNVNSQNNNNLTDSESYIYKSSSIYSYILYSNGNLITHPGQGYNNSDISVSNIQTTGYTINEEIFLLDNFTVPLDGWNINSFEFFIYQSNTKSSSSSSSSSVIEATFELFSGNITSPEDAISIYGDNSTNICCLSNKFTGIYRISKGSSYDDTKRKIYSIEINMQDLFLQPGSYFFKISFSSSSSSTILFYPHLSKPGNAIQYTSPTYIYLKTELPFLIHGLITPQPTISPTQKPSPNHYSFRYSSSSSSSSTSLTNTQSESVFTYLLILIIGIGCLSITAIIYNEFYHNSDNESSSTSISNSQNFQSIDVSNQTIKSIDSSSSPLMINSYPLGNKTKIQLTKIFRTNFNNVATNSSTLSSNLNSTSNNSNFDSNVNLNNQQSNSNSKVNNLSIEQKPISTLSNIL